MLQLTGELNNFLQMQQEECDRLKGITNEIEKSPDVLLCHSDLVEALIDGPIEDEEDPVVIVFHAFLFHER